MVGQAVARSGTIGILATDRNAIRKPASSRARSRAPDLRPKSAERPARKAEARDRDRHAEHSILAPSLLTPLLRAAKSRQTEHRSTSRGRRDSTPRRQHPPLASRVRHRRPRREDSSQVRFDRADAVRQEDSRDHERTRDLGIGRRGDPSHARGPPARARTNDRPSARGATLVGPGTESQLEHEACRYADSVFSGSATASFRIHRTARRARPTGLGPGFSLDPGLRGQAENVLAAKLGAIRLHVGAAAQQHLTQRNALGLTFGSDVLLRARPSDQARRNVLAHELIHVVQQTGVVSDGRVDCRPGHGVGSHGQALARPSFGKALAMEDLLNEHASRSADADVTKSIAAMRSAAGGSNPASATKRAASKIYKKARAKSASENYASLAFDIHKARGSYKRAIRVLKAHPGVTTAFHDDGLVAEAAASKWKSKSVPADLKASSWVDVMWRKHPRLERVRPEAMIAAFLNPLLDEGKFVQQTLATFRGPKTLSRSKPKTIFFTEWAKSELSAAGGHSQQHELYFLTLWAVAEFDALRLRIGGKHRREAEKETYDAWRSRAVLAATYEDTFAPIATGFARAAANTLDEGSKAEKRAVEVSGKGPAEIQVILHTQAPKIVKAVRAARLAWMTTIEALTRGLGDPLTSEDFTSVRKFQEFVGRSRKLANFRTGFEVAVKRVLATTTVNKKSSDGSERAEEQIPKLAVYKAAILQSEKELRGLDRGLSAELLEDAKAIRKEIVAARDWTKVVPPKLIAARLFARQVIREFEEELDAYSSVADWKEIKRQRKAGLAAARGNKKFAALSLADRRRWLKRNSSAFDYRASHRLDVARALLRRVEPMLWHGAFSLVHDALNPSVEIDVEELDVAAQARILLIEGDWTEASVPFKSILTDLDRGAMIKGSEPLRLLDVFWFLQTAELVDRSSFLNKALAKGGKFVDSLGNVRTTVAPDKTLPYAFAEHKKKWVHPQKWTVAGVEFLEHYDGNWAALLSLHPKTQRMLLREDKAGRTDALTTTGSRNPAIYWTFPSFSKLMQRVRKDAAIDWFLRSYHHARWVAQQKAAKKPVDETVELPELPALDDAEWSLLFVQALNKQTADAVAKGEKRNPDTTMLGISRSAFSGTLQKENTAAHTGLVKAYRDMSIATRQYYTEVWLRPLIKESEASGFNKINVRGENPVLAQFGHERAFRKMLQISGMVAPAADQVGHIAAMVASLAVDIHTRWIGGGADPKRKSYDLITTWRPVILTALRFLADPKHGREGSAALETVQSPSEHAGNVLAKTFLEDTNKKWLKHIRELQVTFGVMGRKGVAKGSRGSLRPAAGGHTILAGKGQKSFFRINGVSYSLKEVFEDFIYFDGYRPNAKLGKKAADGTVERKPDDDGSMLFRGRTVAQAPVGPWEDLRDFPLLRMNRDTPRGHARPGNGPVDVSGKDDGLLRELSGAVGLHSVVFNLQQLADAIESIAGFVLDGVELIPGVGQAVAAARIATSVFSVMAGGEFDRLMELVRGDPIENINRGFQNIKDKILTPSSWWKFLLFKKVNLKRPEAKKPDDSTVPVRRRGRLMNLVSKISRFGRRLVGLFFRFQRSIVGKVDRTRLFVLGRPVLSGVIASFAHHAHLLSGLRLDRLFDTSTDDFKTNIKSKINKGVSATAARTRGMFVELQKMTLPKTILPLDDILGIVVDMIVSKLGGKYKFAAKGFLRILEFAGKKQDILRAITGRFEGGALDPNTHLTKLVKEKLNPPITTASNALFDLLSGTVAPWVDGVVDKEEKPFATGLGERPDIKIGVETGDDIDDLDSDPSLDDVDDDAVNSAPPKTQPKLDSAAEPLGPPPQMPSALGGRALPDDLRTNLESQVGQDLRHVRIHRDGVADQLTRSIGASAATSGSHVFMGAGVDPSIGDGQRVLRHEIGHVVQQAGPQTTSANPRATPSLGTPGGGLVIDPAQEAEAERFARASSPDPSALSRGRPAGGMQPSLLTGVVGPLLSEVSSGARLAARATEDARGDASRRLTPAQTKEAGRVWDAVTEAWKNASALKTTGSFAGEKAKTAIAKWLKSKQSVVEKSVSRIAGGALVAVKPKTKGDDPVMLIDPSRFRVGLVGEIFGATGILLGLSFKKATRSDLGTKRAKQPAFDKTAVVKSLSVRNVDLSDIHGASSLWEKAIDNTRSNRVAAKDELWKNATSPKGRSKLRARLRPVLRDPVHSARPWMRNRFAFSERVVKAVRELADASGLKTLDAADLPPKSEYLDTAKVESAPHKNIGLRVGRFGQHKSGKKKLVVPGATPEEIETKGQQKGLERESHHTTQFLLLDFFHNTAPRKAFPLLAHAANNRNARSEVYPGVQARSKEVSRFTGKSEFPIAEFWAGRGALMPAILLARTTHRTGHLHVSRKAADESTSASAQGTQSSVLRRNFADALASSVVGNKLLGAERTALEDSASTPARTRIAKFQATIKALDRGKVLAAIESAMRETYRWMYYDVMEPALRKGLAVQERDYYNDLADAKGSSEKITDREMTSVAETAKENNIRAMKKSGFQT